MGRWFARTAIVGSGLVLAALIVTVAQMTGLSRNVALAISDDPDVAGTLIGLSTAAIMFAGWLTGRLIADKHFPNPED